MAQPYVGEIRMVGFSFAPAGWLLCQGQTLPISENEVLFQLIGTTYGGDGESTFQLPNLQSRVPIHQGTAKSGTTYQMAETGGAESVTITSQSTPIHSHPMVGNSNNGSLPDPGNNVVAKSTTANVDLYFEDVPSTNMASPQAITIVGGSQPHENLQPYLCINYIISLFGVFPSQT